MAMMDPDLYAAACELAINSPLLTFEGMTWPMPSTEAMFDEMVKDYSLAVGTEMKALQFIMMKLQLDLFGNDLLDSATGEFGALCQFYESGLDLMDMHEVAKGMDLLEHMTSGQLQAEQVKLAMIAVQEQDHDSYEDYLCARDGVINDMLTC